MKDGVDRGKDWFLSMQVIPKDDRKMSDVPTKIEGTSLSIIQLGHLPDTW